MRPWHQLLRLPLWNAVTVHLWAEPGRLASEDTDLRAGITGSGVFSASQRFLMFKIFFLQFQQFGFVLKMLPMSKEICTRELGDLGGN